MSLPKISVNIPFRVTGNANIALKSLLYVDYPKQLFEIILIEGNQPAAQRNAGIRLSKGDIIYFLDNDSRVRKNSLRLIANEFSYSSAAALGGPSLTYNQGKNDLSQLIGFALETFFGSLRMRYRYSKKTTGEASEYELIGANLAMRKAVLNKVGGFDERFYPNEETELLRRLKDKGYILQYKRELFIHRKHRKDLSELTKQFYQYGSGRMKQIRINPKIEDILFILPVLFEGYLITLIFYHTLFYVSPLLFYLLLAITTSVKAAIKYKRPDLFFSLPPLFLLIHLSYATGEITEYLKPLFNKQLKLPKRTIKHKIKAIKIKTYTEELSSVEKLISFQPKRGN